MVPNPPTIAAVIQQRRGDFLACMDNVLSDFTFYKGGLRSSTWMESLQIYLSVIEKKISSEIIKSLNMLIAP